MSTTRPWRPHGWRVALWAAGALAAAGGMGWLGFQIPPRSMPATAGASRDLGTIPIPSGLPAPVARYLQATFGDRLPRMETSVVWGTARMRLGPLWLPLRFQVITIPGEAFMRRMQITWFGLPLFHGLDTYIDERGEMKVGGTAVRGPEIDQGANLALWADAITTPSAWFANPRVRWEPIDTVTARMVVPFGAGSDSLTVHFDSETGLLRKVTAERYRTPGQPKEPWMAAFAGYTPVHGAHVATTLTVTWQRDGRPWSVWWTAGIKYNVDVARWLPTQHAEQTVS